MANKKIEPGCLAIIINRAPEDNGKLVKVERYIANEIKEIYFNSQFLRIQAENRWQINTKVLIKWTNKETKLTSFGPEAIDFVPEEHLLRIDGWEFNDAMKETKKRFDKIKPIKPITAEQINQMQEYVKGFRKFLETQANKRKSSK